MMNDVTKDEYKTVEDFINLAGGRNTGHPANEKDFAFFSHVNEEQGLYSFAEKFGLNACEIALINKYTGLVYDMLNEQLRQFSKKRIDGALQYEYLLNKVLYKLDSYNNSIAYVDFFGGYSKNIYKWFGNRINETIQFPNFLSSSNFKWKNNSPLFLEIHTTHNSRGKFIAPVSDNKMREQEVLFISNSKFKILKVLKGKKTIVLEEINDGANANYILYECFSHNIKNKEVPPAEGVLI